MLLDSRSHGRSPSPILHGKRRLTSSDSSDSSLDSHEADPVSLATSSVPTASLLVTNLPTLLFSQAQDLHPLFFPFGHIEKLEIVQVSPLGTMSVVVQYSQASIAQEAKESLGGQRYGSYQVEARYVKPAIPLILELDPRSSTRGNGLIDNRNLVQSVLDPSGRGRASEPPRLPSDHKVDPLLEYFPSSVTGRSRYNSFPELRSRNSSFSAPYPPFSNVFDDPPNFASTSAGLRLFFYCPPLTCCCAKLFEYLAGAWRKYTAMYPTIASIMLHYKSIAPFIRAPLLELRPIPVQMAVSQYIASPLRCRCRLPDNRSYLLALIFLGFSFLRVFVCALPALSSPPFLFVSYIVCSAFCLSLVRIHTILFTLLDCYGFIGGKEAFLGQHTLHRQLKRPRPGTS